MRTYLFLLQPADLSRLTIQPHHEEFEGIGHYSQFMSGIDAIEVEGEYD